MPKNIFSEFKKPGAVQLKGFTAPFRRVVHSARDKVKTYNPGLNTETAAKGLGNISQAGGLLGLGAGIAAIASSAAAGTAFVVAVGGPQVAVTAGVVGLALLVRDAYSNRDRRHEALIPYVWSLIDDEPPAINILDGQNSAELEKAAALAIYLMKEADSQFEGMGNKLRTAELNFDNFINSYKQTISILTAQNGGKWVGDACMHEYKTKSSSLTIPERSFLDQEMRNIFGVMNKAKIDSEKMWNDACKQGNPVFEFMRRLSHVGNYFQCAHIINISIFTKLGNSQGFTNEDPLKKWMGATFYRDKLKEISDLKTMADKNYQDLDNFMTIKGIK